MSVHELEWQGVLAILLTVLVYFGGNEPSTGDFVACLVAFSIDVTVEQELYNGQWLGPMLKGQVQWKAALKPHTHTHTRYF